MQLVSHYQKVSRDEAHCFNESSKARVPKKGAAPTMRSELQMVRALPEQLLRRSLGDTGVMPLSSREYCSQAEFLLLVGSTLCVSFPLDGCSQNALMALQFKWISAGLLPYP
jgi:hypothetical protein